MFRFGIAKIRKNFLSANLFSLFYIDCVSLLPGQLVIHCNTKLIDPRGTSVPLFLFCVASLPRDSPPMAPGREVQQSVARGPLTVALRC